MSLPTPLLLGRILGCTLCVTVGGHPDGDNPECPCDCHTLTTPLAAAERATDWQRKAGAADRTATAAMELLSHALVFETLDEARAFRRTLEWLSKTTSDPRWREMYARMETRTACIVRDWNH